MKSGIHPTYYKSAKITCACGKTYTIGSTHEKLEVEICGDCHPFFTGKDKLVDTAGKAERFKVRREKAAAAPKKTKKTRAKKQEKK